MSFIHRRPEPERSPCSLMLEELADIWAILETLSTRLAALERPQAGDHPQAGPERPSDIRQ